MTDQPIRSVAASLLDYLALEGALKIFGIPGGAAVYVMNELRQRDDIQFVICRQESGAAYMAHGYSLVTGSLGVVLTTSGPGAANALTGALNAENSGAPVLVITGEVPQKYYGRAYLQEGIDSRLDIAAVFKNAVRYSAVVSTADNFHTILQQALREARSVPPAATHISLPNDVASALVPVAGAPTSSMHYRAVPSGLDAAQVGETFKALAEAHRPLIFLGNGCRTALQEKARRTAFADFVAKFGIAVMTTPDAKGIFPETHPMSLRNYGLCGCPWASIYMGQFDDEFSKLAHQFGLDLKPYDTLLVIGSSLGELATTVVEKEVYSPLLVPSQNFIQVDLDQSTIGRNFPLTQGIVADAGATIDELCRLGTTTNPPAGPGLALRRMFIDGIKKTYPPCADTAWRDSVGGPVNPAAAMRIVNEELKIGRIFIDAGNCVGWSLNYMEIDPPVSYHSALAMGPMGFAVAGVVGAKLGAPDVPCIAIVGDGAFMMHGAEVSTAKQNKVGAIWIVLNDNDLGMVSQGMAALFPSQPWEGYYALGAPDLVKFSEGLGARAVAITKDQDAETFRRALRDALRDAERGQPQVIVLHIDNTLSPPYGWPKLG
jgi:acetolactate synthase I/II/III large subunit